MLFHLFLPENMFLNTYYCSLSVFFRADDAPTAGIIDNYGRCYTFLRFGVLCVIYYISMLVSIMALPEVGYRPLLVTVIDRALSYYKMIMIRNSTLTIKAINFESTNDVMPNFLLFFRSFGIDYSSVTHLSKEKIKKLCRTIYDNYWWNKMMNSPKALSYVLIKTENAFEPYLATIKDYKMRNYVSRFRMSNHQLMIEKGRRMRPKIDRDKRFCFNCHSEIENELHFVINCPIYKTERLKLFEMCRRKVNGGIQFDRIPTDQQKFIFIMTTEDHDIMHCFANYLRCCFKKREDCLDTIRLKSSN